MLTRLFAWLAGETSVPDHAPRWARPRSPLWPKVRAEHLRHESSCRVCGAKTGLAVHHKQPFHLFPGLELVDSNLITLCEGKDGGCHFRFGHLWNWAAWNSFVDEDCTIWAAKIQMRNH